MMEKELLMTERQKDALLAAAAGRHNVLFFGKPGCGKTLLLHALQELLPPLSEEEAVSVNRIRDLAGLRPTDEDWYRRPFRTPHQTATLEGMCGGGPGLRPGEVSLAHNGVLFLDEAAEFRSSVLQMLRVPLESGQVTLARAGRSTVFPADFQLAMAANSCPCGNYGSDKKICLCSARSVELYWRKFSAPLLDRVSIVLDFNKDEDEEKKAYEVEDLKALVLKAVDRQKVYDPEEEEWERLWNSEANPNGFLRWDTAETRLEELSESWSARKKASCAQVARTLADLDGEDYVTSDYIDRASGLMDEVPFN